MVFAELAGADTSAGDRAVADVLRGMAEEPGPPVPAHAQAVRFWRRLIGALGRHTQSAPAMAGPLARLAGVSPGRRALWLLARLSVLDPVALAAILDLPPARIRASLASTEMQLGPALADCLAALRNRQAALSTARMARMDAWRAPGPVVRAARTRRSRWRIAAAWVAAVATLAGFLWTFDGVVSGAGEPDIRTRPLAQGGEPRRYDAAAAVRLHPDRQLLAMPESEASIARDAAFYSWFAAERAGRSGYQPALPTGEAPEGSSGMPGETDAH